MNLISGRNNVRKKSIGINAVLNLIKVASTILFPLITFPYISRVLQVDNVGRINYGTSVVNYFALVAALGVNIYGVREGSRQKKGKQFDSFASEVFSLNLLSTAISYLTLITLVLTVPKFRDYRSVILILSLSIVLTTFGIEWVNTVFEDYLYITLRSLVVQILCMVAMFVIIKKPEDYLKYALITVASSGITCVANWIYCRRYTKLCLVFNASIFRHLRPMLIFFANHLAITIYVTADTTMLGWMKGDFYSGLYAVSVKVYQCVKSLMTAVYMVTIPELSRLATSGDRGKYRKLLTDISCSIILLILPCMAGLIAFARNIIILISGTSYVEATLSLQILGVALLFAVASGVVVNCINTPNGMERYSLFATVIAAIVNVILNIFLIPVMAQDGAALTTVIAEVTVFVICLIRISDVGSYVDVKEIVKQLLIAAAGSGLVFGSKYFLDRCFTSSVAILLLGILISPVLYAVFLGIVRDKYFLSVIRGGLKKIRRD